MMSNNPAGSSDAAVDARVGDAASGARDAGLDAALDGSTRDSSTNSVLDAALNRDAGASTSDAAVTPAADYTKAENWLCRPDRRMDACDVDLTTTVVAANGTLEEEKYTAAANPGIDCFYVYPTVSLDATPNSDLLPGDEENAVVRAQFARFGSQCRLFAPMYRQITLTTLRASLAGTPSMADSALGYRDVLAAWRWYMQNENKGRGVVLVSHSQGSSVLTRLIQEQIDPNPATTPLLAAFLIGTNVTVPPGQHVGGSFQKVPLCKTAEELGCVVAYVSFRSNVPPPEKSRFGKSPTMGPTAGQQVACVNPANLAGGPSQLKSYLSKDGAGASGMMMGPWVPGDATKVVNTPFVRVPGLITGECKTDASGTYLSVTVTGDAADPRVDDIVGDVVTNGMRQDDWGLHLIDVHLTMGNMLDLVQAKARAFQMR